MSDRQKQNSLLTSTFLPKKKQFFIISRFSEWSSLPPAAAAVFLSPPTAYSGYCRRHRARSSSPARRRSWKWSGPKRVWRAGRGPCHCGASHREWYRRLRGELEPEVMEMSELRRSPDWSKTSLVLMTPVTAPLWALPWNKIKKPEVGVVKLCHP